MIVAEISASHDGSLQKAFDLIDAAVISGAEAIKFQTFEPELIAARNYTIQSGPWLNWSLQDLYRKAYTPKEWHASLFEYVTKMGVIPFSTPFHQSDVDFLEKINCPIYKIASFEMINIPLIEYAASTGKPIIISNGMATIDEISAAVDAVERTGNNNLTLLHCISSYPAKDFYIQTMVDMRERFDVKVGISDHTPDETMAIAATALGAEVIEKHICLDHDGLDGGFALLPEEFQRHVEAIHHVKDSMQIKYGPKPGEEPSYALRPSLRFKDDLPNKTIIDKSHLHISRPGNGLHPSYQYQIIGQRLKKAVSKDDPVHLDDLIDFKKPLQIKKINWTDVFKDLERVGQVDSKLREKLGVPWSTYHYFRTEGYEPKDSISRALLEIHTNYCGESLTQQRIKEAR